MGSTVEGLGDWGAWEALGLIGSLGVAAGVLMERVWSDSLSLVGSQGGSTVGKETKPQRSVLN